MVPRPWWILCEGPGPVSNDEIPTFCHEITSRTPTTTNDKMEGHTRANREDREHNTHQGLEGL